MLITVATQSAMNLHNILVKAVLGAPMFFLETTDSGSLLNRFSQDMSMVDLAVPVSIFAVILSELAVLHTKLTGQSRLTYPLQVSLV
jgi:ATP-binding cassette subfamily C (CFTR/MRP) protein 1